MIIINPKMFDGRLYGEEAKDNTEKLKSLMTKLVIQEEAKKDPPVSGGAVRRYNYSKKPSKPKTFKL